MATLSDEMSCEKEIASGLLGRVNHQGLKEWPVARGLDSYDWLVD